MVIELPTNFKQWIALTLILLGIMSLGAAIGFKVGFDRGLNLNPQKLEILESESWDCYPRGFNQSYLNIDTLDWGYNNESVKK
jgi:hypothetical protein